MAHYNGQPLDRLDALTLFYLRGRDLSKMDANEFRDLFDQTRTLIGAKDKERSNENAKKLMNLNSQ